MSDARDGGNGDRPGGWPLVILAWAAVGIPLCWGVWMTMQKAALLFR